MAAKKTKEVQQAIQGIHKALQMKHLPTDELEELVKVAIDILNRDYWDDVRGLTADIIRRVKDGEIKDRDGLQEAVHEAVDGSQRVMYTWQARLGLLSTNNLDAYEESMGDKPEGPEQQMFMAMEADVFAQLDAEDVDSYFRDEDD